MKVNARKPQICSNFVSTLQNQLFLRDKTLPKVPSNQLPYRDKSCLTAPNGTATKKKTSSHSRVGVNISVTAIFLPVTVKPSERTTTKLNINKNIHRQPVCVRFYPAQGHRFRARTLMNRPLLDRAQFKFHTLFEVVPARDLSAILRVEINLRSLTTKYAKNSSTFVINCTVEVNRQSSEISRS